MRIKVYGNLMDTEEKSSSFSFSRSKKDLDRISEIVGILAKYQAGKYAGKLLHKEGLPLRIPKIGTPPQISRMNPQERLHAMLEELGTTFVKLGQLLGTRDDIIGVEYAAELSKLQDKMQPFPAEEAKRVIKEELGKSVTELFAHFESEPMASASVAQVHRALLKNGKRVVVKVQRPGIEERVKEDIRIMHYLAFLAERNIPEIRKYDPRYLVNEFERSMIKELDFLREAKNSERLKENFKNNKGVYVPIVYDEMCTKRVLVMEEIIGTKLSDIIDPKKKTKEFNRKVIAQRCLHAFFQMVLVDGFYHADPHPGNIIIIGKDTICFLDFGRCATIDRELAESIFKLALFAVDDDVNGLIAHLVRTNLIGDNIDMQGLKTDLTDLLDMYYSTEIRNVKIGHMLADLMTIIGGYDFNRPRELAELTRALLILEGAGQQLDPTFNIAEEFEPFATEFLAPNFDAEKIGDIIKSNLLDFEYIARDFPNSFRKFMKKMSEGKITLELEHKNLAIITADMKNVSDRISVAMILAALIVGSSVIVLTLPDNILGLLLFAISAALGVWLVVKTLFM
jgi:ubiquinone biosynthesis protein